MRPFKTKHCALRLRTRPLFAPKRRSTHKLCVSQRSLIGRPKSFVYCTSADSRENGESVEAVSITSEAPIDETDSVEKKGRTNEGIPDPASRKQKMLVLSSEGMEPLALMRPVPYPSWHGLSTNVVMAALVLISIRLSRWSTERAERQRFGTHVSVENFIGANRELATRRKEFEKKRQLLQEEEAKKRLEQAEIRAKQEAAAKLEREKRYQKEKEAEEKRLRAAKERQREKFEEQERAMQTELERRDAIARELRAENEAKRIAEAEHKRKIEEERRREEEKKHAAAEAERQRELEEEIRRKEEEKRALNALKSTIAMRFEGEAKVKRAESGIRAAGNFEREAVLTVFIKMRTSLMDNYVEFEEHYASVDDARDAVAQFVGFVCRGSIDGYMSNIRLQSMTGTGTLSKMDDLELALFSHVAAIQAHDQFSSIVENLLSDFVAKPAITTHGETFTVRYPWGVLPDGHEKRLDVVITNLLSQLQNKELDSAAVASALVDRIEFEMESWESGYEEALKACFLAHVFDRSLKMKDTEVYDATVSIVRSLLNEFCSTSPLDSLLPQSIALTSAIGDQHLLCGWFEELAQKNLSLQKRRERKEMQERLDAALKARVLQQQWPDHEKRATELQKQREEATPVPERVWALRNVARTIVTGGSPSASAIDQSVELMKKALRLQEKFLGSATHPGMLGPLRDYANILSRVDMEISGVIWTRIVAILQQAAERYRKQGDLFSCALTAEAGVLSAETVLDPRHASLKKLNKVADAAIPVLNDAEITRLVEIRRSKTGMDLVVDAFTPQLGAYKPTGKLDRIEQWNQNKDRSIKK